MLRVIERMGEPTTPVSSESQPGFTIREGIFRFMEQPATVLDWTEERLIQFPFGTFRRLSNERMRTVKWEII